MDPNACLNEIRDLVDSVTFTPSDGSRLRELISGLDQWLSKGGFLPSDWAGKYSVYNASRKTDQKIAAEARENVEEVLFELFTFDNSNEAHTKKLIKEFVSELLVCFAHERDSK